MHVKICSIYSRCIVQFKYSNRLINELIANRVQYYSKIYNVTNQKVGNDINVGLNET